MKLVCACRAATVAIAIVLASLSGNLWAQDKPALKVKAGDVPPPELGLTRDGRVVETKQFAGKVLVVTFWATWCAPCRAEIGYLEALQRRVSKDILQVVAVNIETRDVFREAIRKMHDYQMIVANDQYKRYADAYGVAGIPHMLIIGKDGRIVNVHRGYSEQAIPKLVNEIVEALYVGVERKPQVAPVQADAPASPS